MKKENIRIIDSTYVITFVPLELIRNPLLFIEPSLPLIRLKNKHLIINNIQNTKNDNT